MNDDLEESNLRVLRAALEVKDDLPPHEAERLVKLLVEADIEDQEGRATAVDRIVELLDGHDLVGERYAELTADTERGAADVWAPDSVPTKRSEDETSGLLSFRCRTCGFLNRLHYRPTQDDLPRCENPDAPVHLLRMP